MPPKGVRVIRSGTSRGAHLRALRALLLLFEEQLPDLIPHPQRVQLRNHRAALERAYPEFFAVNEVELSQYLAEEDGDEVTE